MEVDPIVFELIKIAVTILTASTTSIILIRNLARTQKSSTSQLIFDKCYFKIFSLIEYKLFSKELSLTEVRDIGSEIVEIFNSSEGYYYPSLKIYAERLAKSDTRNYQENWAYFSTRFSSEYDKVCAIIKIPLRSRAYRINRNQYGSWYDFLRVYFLNLEGILELIFLLFLIFMIIQFYL
ncbi:hypothetical protein [uncultured Enterococcus sp.]|uniref:hypothetical protein n=1 Tax=uncultured Enterococcus sp. TaxID=167972 RepID=UPI002AA889D5|nr:hypothetical protein [uncultured Enterococcus sp.]